METTIMGYMGFRAFFEEIRSRIRPLGFRVQGVGKQAKALRPETLNPLHPPDSPKP